MVSTIAHSIRSSISRHAATKCAAGICLLLATVAAAQQQPSLAEQATQAVQTRASWQPAQPSAREQESLAEQTKQVRAKKLMPAADSADDSLGEQARRIAQEHALLVSVRALRPRSPVPFVYLVEPPPSPAQSRAFGVRPRANPGASPAGKHFSLGSIFRGHPVPPSGGAKPAATASVAAPPEPAQMKPAITTDMPLAQSQAAPAPPPARVSSPPQSASAPVPGTSAAALSPQEAPAAELAPALKVRTEFKVKYVAQDAVYLLGGKNDGLAEGMKLSIRRRGEGDLPVIAELEVVSVAASSAVCDVKKLTGEIHAGDIAYMSQLDAEILAQTRAVGGSRKYPQVVTFTEGDPLDEEAREEVPRPPLPEVNRARGRIGLDFSGVSSRGSVAASSHQIGGVLRADITRIGGTYWNLSGYWRGRLNSRSYAGQPTLQDLINRTYHLSMTYNNPKSSWVAGFGRLYLPWASSLDTLDGGYVGRRVGHGATAGVFAGSTPDPTSWNYDPQRRIAGAFVNFEGGSFDSVHYSSTSGLALTSLGWTIDRPFVFFENGIFYKRFLSIYQSAQIDDPHAPPGMTKAGAGLSRSYITLRVQPHNRISFDFNHNYFRDVPTFSQQLISTGLLDKYLFQGFSAGVRVQPVRHITLYTDLGRSNRTGDQKSSINQLYGITWDRLWKTGLRADLRYSKFDSSFGSGTYRSLSLSRNFGERLHWQVQAGRQTLVSSFTGQGDSRFLNFSADAALAAHYFIQADYTAQRGGAFDYDQWIFTFGYRFDIRSKKGEAR